MDWVFGIVAIVVFVIFGRKIGDLNGKVEHLEGAVLRLQTKLTLGVPIIERDEAPINMASEEASPPAASAEEFYSAQVVADEPPQPAALMDEVQEPEQPSLDILPPKPPAPAPVAIDWEKTLGVRLPVWGGAIMLLIAGFFLINWAIEAGITSIFTPEVRTALCGLAAAGLLAAAFIVKHRQIANGDRISSALATAAVAVGYGTVFLAASVFHLVPGIAALVGAIVVTAAAIMVAIQFDRRVMLVGLLGGYLSPFFVWSIGSSGGLVAIYAATLLTVSLFAIRWNGWWGQLLAALIGPTLWAVALVIWTDSVTLAVFYLSLAAIPAAIALLPLQKDQEALSKRHGMVFLGTIASAALLVIGAAVHRFDIAFAVAEVALSIGGLLLIRWDPTALRNTWLSTLASALIILLAWQGADRASFLVIALLLSATHLGALALQFRLGADKTARSFEIAGVSTVFFVILLVKLDGWIGARDIPYIWAGLALLAAGAFAALAIKHIKAEHQLGGHVGFAVGANAFLSLGLGLALDPALYALVAALHASGLALLYSRFRHPVLEALHIVYAGLYGALLIVGQAVSGAEGVFYNKGGLADFIPSVGMQDAPITLLLIPGLLFLGAATLFTRIAYSEIPKALDAVAIVLLAFAIHFLILPNLPSDIFEQAFVIGSVWFNALALLAVAAMYAGGRLDRSYLVRAGSGIAGVVAVAMLIYAIVPIFRFWPTIQTPGVPLFNVALTALGLPAALLLVAAYLSRKHGSLQIARGLAAFGGLAGLITVLVLIRQAIHGPSLNGPGAVPGQIELYLYSGGMLLYGFAMLWGGAAFSSIALRAGSLLVVLATIGKVFLYDVSDLDGLWRVGSFLGLGLALLAVSWFYGRFVFGIGPSGRKKESVPAE